MGLRRGGRCGRFLQAATAPWGETSEKITLRGESQFPLPVFKREHERLMLRCTNCLGLQVPRLLIIQQETNNPGQDLVKSSK